MLNINHNLLSLKRAYLLSNNNLCKVTKVYNRSLFIFRHLLVQDLLVQFLSEFILIFGLQSEISESRNFDIKKWCKYSSK